MPQADAEHLPVKEGEDHRQHRQGAEVADEHPVAQLHAGGGEHAVEKSDEAPAHGAEDNIEVREILFHGVPSWVISRSLSQLSRRSSMI